MSVFGDSLAVRSNWRPEIQSFTSGCKWSISAKWGESLISIMSQNAVFFLLPYLPRTLWPQSNFRTFREVRSYTYYSTDFFLLFAPPSPQVRLDHRGQVSAHFSLSTCTFLQDNMVHFHLQTQVFFFYLPAICQDLGYYQSPSPRPGFHILSATFAHIEPLLFQMVIGQKQHLRLPTWAKEAAGRCCQCREGTKHHLSTATLRRQRVGIKSNTHAIFFFPNGPRRWRARLPKT